MIIHKSNQSITQTVQVLKAGGVIIVPTDTVYGFSGICEPSMKTDDRIRRIKGREESKPMIKLIASPSQIHSYTDDEIPKTLLDMWPGPLTVIVHDKDGQGTTAYRCPSDPWLCKVIEQCGYPIFSTSVNKSGQSVLETESEICSVFEKDCDLIVLDGDRKNAKPSTIVKIEDGKVVVLRQGELVIS